MFQSGDQQTPNGLDSGCSSDALEAMAWFNVVGCQGILLMEVNKKDPTPEQTSVFFFLGGGSESIFHFHDYEMKSSYNVYIHTLGIKQVIFSDDELRVSFITSETHGTFRFHETILSFGEPGSLGIYYLYIGLSPPPSNSGK